MDKIRNRVYFYVSLIFIFLIVVFTKQSIGNDMIKEKIQDNNSIIIESKVNDIIKKPVNIERFKKGYFIVTVNGLNVREHNNTNSTVIRVLDKDDLIEIISSEGDWYETNTHRFVNKNYLERINDYDNFKLTSRGSRQPVYNVNSRCNLSINDFKKLLDGSKLEGLEYAILKAENKYGINGLFILAVAKLESGNGTSKIAKYKNNLFGLNAVDSDPYNKAFYFNSKSESVYTFANIINKYYVSNGLTTIRQINTRYSSSKKWTGKVYSIMNVEYKKLQKIS